MTYRIDISASHEIYRLAQQFGLEHVELARECQYFGSVNGRDICVSVFDRDPQVDLDALRAALQKIANGPLRTATAFREIAKSALDKTPPEENETANDYVSDNGQFGVGA